MSGPEPETMQDSTTQDFDPYGDASPMPVVAYQEPEENIHPTEHVHVITAETTDPDHTTTNESSEPNVKGDTMQISHSTNALAPATESNKNLPGLDIDHTADSVVDSNNIPDTDMTHRVAAAAKAEDIDNIKSNDAEEVPPAVTAREMMETDNESPGAVPRPVSLEKTNEVSNTTDTEIADAEMVLQDIPLQPEQNGGSTAPEVEYDSSAGESSSDDSLSTDSDDAEDSEEDYELLDPAEQARRLMEGDGSDDEGGKTGSGGVLRTVNEKEDEAVEIPDIPMTPETKIEELGKVEAVVDSMILIKAKTSGEYQVLESGSALCTINRVVIGAVAETLGRVQEPLYCVRFTNAQTISGFGIERDTPIYYIPGHAHFVFTQALQGMKGSDASNIHDEEVGRDEIEFSDDEAEAEYKRQKKLQKQERKGLRGGSTRGRGDMQRGTPRAQEHDSGLSLPYDDTNMEDQLYTPLVRPASMNTPGQQISHNQSNDGYSRGAGGMRGFGNRGRGGNRGRANGNHYSNGRQQVTPLPTMPSQGFQSHQQQPFQFPPTNPQLQPPYPVQGFQMSQSYDQFLRGQFPAPQHTYTSQYNQNNQWTASPNAHQQQQQQHQQSVPQQQTVPQQQYVFPGYQNVLPPGAIYNPAFYPNQTGNPPG